MAATWAWEILDNLPSSQMTSRSSASISKVLLSIVMVVFLSRSAGGAGGGGVGAGFMMPGNLGPFLPFIFV